MKIFSEEGDVLTDEISDKPLAAHYHAIFEAAPDGILVVDEEGKICELNPEAIRLFGYGPEELLGQPIELLVPVEARTAHAAERDEYMRHPRTRPMGVDLELRARRKDGSEFPVEISLSPMPTATGTRVISVIRDIRQQKRYRKLGRAALEAAEAERRRIALDLHDDMAQRLAALLLRLQLARETTDGARREELLEEVRQEILATAEALHDVAVGLRPPALASAGVEAAIRLHVRNVLAESDIEARLDLALVDERLDEDEKVVLYRVVQEALSNAVRHSRAGSVTVRVFEDAGQIVGEVEDDGIGFDVEEAMVQAEGLGLLGMRERALTVGGRTSVTSAAGQGTRVRIELAPGESAVNREAADG